MRSRSTFDESFVPGLVVLEARRQTAVGQGESCGFAAEVFVCARHLSHATHDGSGGGVLRASMGARTLLMRGRGRFANGDLLLALIRKGRRKRLLPKSMLRKGGGAPRCAGGRVGDDDWLLRGWGRGGGSSGRLEG